MFKTAFIDHQMIKDMIGQEVGVSAWLKIDQARINLFANASSDHQWIHTDPVRAAQDSPFGKTIAHGFLTLSLVPYFMDSCISFEHTKLTINYGLNKVRFTSPVLEGSFVRTRFTLNDAHDVDHGMQIEWLVTMDIEEKEKPALVANFLIQIYN